MSTSVFFNNFQSSQEQFLIEDLVLESIRIYGIDLYYLPRTRTAFDTLYGEDTLSVFSRYYFVDMYVKNVDGFDGDGDFISKFGLEIRDRMTLTISRRVFNEEIGNLESIERPQEGDLIFFPLNNKIFEIKFVEHESVFYQMGALQTYDLTCELFEYGSEQFNTGIVNIDSLYTKNYLTDLNYSTAITDFSIKTEYFIDEYLTDEEGRRLLIEQYLEVGDSEIIQSESDGFIDFSELNPFSEGVY